MCNGSRRTSRISVPGSRSVVRTRPPTPTASSGAALIGVQRTVAGSPEAHEAGDERDEEDLSGQHLEHGEDLTDVALRDQVAVARGRQRGVAEEHVVA